MVCKGLDLGRLAPLCWTYQVDRQGRCGPLEQEHLQLTAGDLYTVFSRWRIWLLVALLAGMPFGLLMFGALQFAPYSHAAVFPFTAMSVMGMVLGAVVLTGLVPVSGLEASSLTLRAAIGDAMFVLAGTLWAGFGIVLRKHRLDPLLATAVISISALLTYVPAYFWYTGAAGLIAAQPSVFWTEVLVQGVIAGAGTLYTYSKMVSLLGASRAAVFPALAPGLAALMAWPVLGHVPAWPEAMGLLLVMTGLVVAVTSATSTNAKS